MKGLKQLHNNCYALRLLILFPLQTYRNINTGEKHPGKENAKNVLSSYGLCFFNKSLYYELLNLSRAFLNSQIFEICKVTPSLALIPTT